VSIRVYVPRDSSALSLGAESVASAVAVEAARRKADVTIVRNGSRGLYWLEPMVEVETAQGRIAYGPVAMKDVAALFDADFLRGGRHPLFLGPTEKIPYLQKQERLTFARVGITDPLSLADYAAHGGWKGLREALGMDGAVAVKQVTDSGLRGRGGAAFPAGIKWKTVLDTPSYQKYVVCNADEGDSGTYSDRMIMEGDPYVLIEGMAIAGVAVGATHGYIYVRSEYPHSCQVLAEAIALAKAGGFLGDNILGSDKAFELEVRKGAGAYICGEETSLPIIFANGAAHYRDFGMGRSRGTLPIQLAGNLKYCGLVEKAFGVTLRELLYDYGGGSASGRPIRAVQVGGPLGAYLPEQQFDTPLDYEAFVAIGAMVGHGGIVAFDDTVDMAGMARYAMEFCAIESCGKCTPCRIGSTRGVEVIDHIVAGSEREKNIALLEDLCDTMLNGSLCALGGMTPFPVQSALKYFPNDFKAAPKRKVA
jgi:formate dehydrogenase iron-sulfur subunit